MRKYRILLIDEDQELLDALEMTLANAGYVCIPEVNGEKAIETALKNPPDLIILDKIMTKMDGITLASRIKKKPRFSQVPILMLTAACTIEDKISALESYVDDYVCKPFSTSELLAKIRAILRHSTRTRDSHPTTHLPGGNALEEEINRRIVRGDTFALMHVDIDNFKAYADSYGFNKANRMIRMVGASIVQVVESMDLPNTFISHVGGDDFIIVTDMEHYELLAEEIIAAFDGEVAAFFTEEDLARKVFTGLTRRSQKRDFPITTVSIGIISNEEMKFEDAAETSDALARAKNKAKQKEPGKSAASSYFYLDLK